MRNIADIISDDKNGKQLSQTERQIAVAYIQGKYDAVMELKNINNSNDMEVLDEIRAEIEQLTSRYTISRERGGMGQVEWSDMLIKESEVLQIIDKYKAEIKPQESEE